MIEAGHFAAFLALALSLAQGVLGLRGERRTAGLLAVTAFGLMALSFLTIVNAFVTSDFSVALVANNSHTLKPMVYKIAGAWGNHEGSMAMWCLVTIGFGAAGAAMMRTGRDLFEATPIHVLLQTLLGLPVPVYHHHRLIRDESGRRLAKRDDSRALSLYRSEGATPEDIRQMVGLPVRP